jgi:hypothetical protein
MERRAFIKGVLTSVAGGTALVQLAQPGEANALIAQQGIVLAQPESKGMAPLNMAVLDRPEMFMKLHGEYVAVGYFKSIEVHNGRLPDRSDRSWTIMGKEAPGLKEVLLRVGGPL